MNTEKITTAAYEIWLDEDGIVRADHIAGTVVTLSAAQETVAAIAELLQGKKAPLLVDLSHITESVTDRETRAYFASEEGTEPFKAIATLVSTPVSKAIGKFFISVNEPLIPYRLFTSEAEAREWLKGFLD